MFLSPNVQGSPFAVPVERYPLGAAAGIEQLCELVKFDASRAILVEESEGDLVLGIRLSQQVVKEAPVLEIDLADTPSISYAEQDAVLLALDLVLRWR